jgi:hypothetical protein
MSANIDYIYWDRRGSSEETAHILSNPAHARYEETFAHLLREATCDEVWSFVSPQTVRDALPRMAHKLGRRQRFWEWLIAAWEQRGLI